MAWLKVETAQLLPEIRRALTELLRGLEPDDWSAPTVCDGWTVGDVVTHLLGVELGNVSRRRDRSAGRADQGSAPPTEWLAAFNDSFGCSGGEAATAQGGRVGSGGEWVSACRGRLSPRVVADLIEVAGPWFEAHVATLDPDLLGGPVLWAGSRPAPVWMDIAREYTERWVHQQQIREAVSRPGLQEGRYLGPVIGTFVHALPAALAETAAPEGTSVGLRVVGDGGGEWHAIRWHNEWDLWPGLQAGAVAEVVTSVDNAWRMFTRHPQAVPLDVRGDRRLAGAIGGAVAILG